MGGTAVHQTAAASQSAVSDGVLVKQQQLLLLLQLQKRQPL
jgi:hypothetical protein